MTSTIRAANPDTDYVRIAELIQTYERQPITANSLREWDANTREGTIRHRIVAVDSDERITAYSGIVRDNWVPEGVFMLWVVVDPQARGQGIGTQVYDEAYHFALDCGAVKITSDVLDSDVNSLHFAEKRGFKIDHHTFESMLDLHTFNPDKFAATTAHSESQGIHIFSLEEAGFNDDNLYKLWYVNQQTVLDEPGVIAGFPNFDEFKTIINGGAWFRPDGQILAADGDTYVGLSAVGYYKESNSAYNMMTGIMPSHRGKGIAQALKLRSIQAAKNWGADFIRTNNDSHNAPMLAINRKLGYAPQPGVYQLSKVLEG
ncbi:MAG: GNAT family N-acetyltransferase [Anaerolineae bacterium]|nr:GNAT family N-acetyltransferase [Anaerolineae bacterium]